MRNNKGFILAPFIIVVVAITAIVISIDNARHDYIATQKSK